MGQWHVTYQQRFLADDGSLIADFTKGLNSADQQFCWDDRFSLWGIRWNQYLVDVPPRIS